MNLKRLFAGVLACCIVGGALPSVMGNADNAVITVSAADDEEYTEGTYESLTYKNYGGHIEISKCDTSATSVEIPAEIDGLPVTLIGISSFQDCTSLESITIPDSVTSIGRMAFSGCSALISITIPDSVTSIGNYAFSGCRGLTKITIPDGVTSIGDYVFTVCLGLTEITIPDSVTSIGDYAFIYCEALTEITIPDGVTSIGRGAFSQCSKLTEITIPNNVTSIGYGAFCDCSELKEITIPDSVTKIDISTFEYCTELKEITILNPNCEIYDSKDTISNGYDENGVENFSGTIYGYDNSTAQAYAEKYNRKFVSLGAAPEKTAETGDIDGDGIIDSSDASFVLTEYSLLSTGKGGNLSDSVKKLADLNKDGTIDASDASLILAYYSHTATGGTDSIDVFLGKQGY